ncbi:hypothetical protein [Streptomyces gardneri]|uniref:hypothetical protein n=1 Tax=Streptomyces gardneri TaxID=66892 RepID=UPI0035D825F9
MAESPTVEETVEGLFPSEETVTEEPTVEAEPSPTGPAAEINATAEAEGWLVGGLYDTPADFVEDICDSLEDEENGKSHAQWLVEGGHLEGDQGKVLLYGVPKLCPGSTGAVKAAVSGKYDRWFGNGTYVVSSKPIEGEETIPPGTYQAVGKMDDCYWERTSESGEIIANSFATSARKITVTIRSSDGQFTSERCAAWRPVK